MREKPKHEIVVFHDKKYNHNTRRCFYIDGVYKFGFFIDSDTDISVILDKFVRNKDFISVKEYCAPAWDHIGFLDYFPETNEVFLTTDKKTKNLIIDGISVDSMAKEKKRAQRAEKKQQEQDRNLANLEEGVSVAAGSEENFKTKVKEMMELAKEVFDDQRSGKQHIIISSIEIPGNILNKAANKIKEKPVNKVKKKVSKNGVRSLI